MQERYQNTSARSARPYRSNHDNESKLEQIKREVKSWFADDGDDDWQSDRYHRDHDRIYDGDHEFGSKSQPIRSMHSESGLIPGPYVGTGPKGYQRSSESLKEAVCDRLERAGRIDASEIEVEVDKCEVTLTGKVRSREQKRLAEDCAEGVRGIRDVHNRLNVDSNMGLSSNDE